MCTLEAAFLLSPLTCPLSNDSNTLKKSPLWCRGIGNTTTTEIQVPALTVIFKGCLAGSVGGACDSLSQGCGFEPRVGCRVYLKYIKTIYKKLSFKYAGTPALFHSTM